MHQVQLTTCTFNVKILVCLYLSIYHLYFLPLQTERYTCKLTLFQPNITPSNSRLSYFAIFPQLSTAHNIDKNVFNN